MDPKANSVKIQQSEATIVPRLLYSFMVDDETLSCIYRNFAPVDAPREERVNITARIQTKLEPFCQDCNLVRLVVGSPDGTINDDAKAVKVLKELGVKYRQDVILQVLGFLPGTPGVISGIFGRLYCRGVNVISSTIGEAISGQGCENVTYIQVASEDIEKTIEILSADPPLDFCPADCCPGSACNCRVCRRR